MYLSAFLLFVCFENNIQFTNLIKINEYVYLLMLIGVANLNTNWSPDCGNNPQKKVSPRYALSRVYCL